MPRQPPRGSVALNESRSNGNEIAFAVIRVKGDTMTLQMTVGAREPLDVTAKRGD
jgi:hypothetical protein